MPHVVDVRCPRCGSGAEFEFAEVRRIELKRDVPFFRKSKLFEHRLMRDSLGNGWHAAIFYARLQGRSVEVLRGLPTGYAPADWAHSRYFLRHVPKTFLARNARKLLLERLDRLLAPALDRGRRS